MKRSRDDEKKTRVGNNESGTAPRGRATYLPDIGNSRGGPEPEEEWRARVERWKSATTRKEYFDHSDRLDEMWYNTSQLNIAIWATEWRIYTEVCGWEHPEGCFIDEDGQIRFDPTNVQWRRHVWKYLNEWISQTGFDIRDDQWADCWVGVMYDDVGADDRVFPPDVCRFIREIWKPWGDGYEQWKKMNGKYEKKKESEHERGEGDQRYEGGQGNEGSQEGEGNKGDKGDQREEGEREE